MLNNNYIGRSQDVAATLELPGTLPPPVLQESLFVDEGSVADSSDGPVYDVNLSVDSFIIAFTGPRGAGKTTTMVYLAIKAYLESGTRVLSNFPVEFYLKRAGSSPELVRFEILDWEKLLCFDEEYRNCLILLDEAPDVISNLASMTWKNRLLNIFVRQLRKNRNSLFLGAQSLEFIDKSMRWQTDIECQCADASRRYGWGAESRGECVLVRLLDMSGMWTGMRWQDRLDFGKEWYMQGMLYPRVLWGEPGKTAAAFDSWATQNIWETLRKVDMKLNSYKIGPGNTDIGTTGAFYNSVLVANAVMQGGGVVGRGDFWAAVGNMTAYEKDSIAKRLARAGVITKRSGNKTMYDFNGFDVDLFGARDN